MPYLFILLLTFLSFTLHAQRYSTESKAAIKRFEKALDYYKVRENAEALEQLGKALEKDEFFIEAYLLRAEIYNEEGDREAELLELEQVVRIQPDYDPRTYYYIAISHFQSARYEKALEAFQSYLDYGDEGDKIQQSEFFVECCLFAQEAMKNPLSIELTNLGSDVNTPYNDMMPALTADELTLYFTVDVPITDELPHGGRNRQEDFFFSRRQDNVWSESMNLGPPVNTPGNEGALTVSGDGFSLVYASSSLPEGHGSTDLYASSLTADGWSKPINLGSKVNSSSWDSQPSLSSDGQMLFFVSNRPGGYGRQDIWYSWKDENGNWTEPQNAGPAVNTPRDENSPFFHHDGETLYFSSNGHVGLGGMDLFKVRFNRTEGFSKPVNLGYPVNTHENEEFLVINAAGNRAYLSSERPGSNKKDLYSFDLPQAIRPNPVVYVKGKVFDEEVGNPLFTEFTLIDLESGETILKSESSPVNGDYLVCLPSGRDYAFRAAKEGYLFYSENFSLKEKVQSTEPFFLDIPLQAIKSGKTVVLNNVFFDTDKFELKDESKYELGHLVRFMQENPGLRIEIRGHTDNQGSEAYNLELSKQRAHAVYDYLVAKGIQDSRLSYRGYGMMQPLADNETEAGRAKNRRTEFSIQ